MTRETLENFSPATSWQIAEREPTKHGIIGTFRKIEKGKENKNR